MKTKTPLIDLAPKLFVTIRTAQEELAKWIEPDSKITDKEILNTLLGILDNQELVRAMKKIEHE